MIIKLGKLEIEYQPLWWWQADTRGVEVLSAIIAFAWMGVLLLPGSTVSRFPSLAVMNLFGGDHTWASIFGMVWMVQSLAMCGNVRINGNRIIARYASALLSMGLWSFMASTVFLQDYLAAGWAVYTALAASMFWVIVRGPTKHDAG